MNKEEIADLNPDLFKDTLITVDEVFYIAKTLDAFWEYDYKAAEAGRAGKHALLKSGLHSDGFFISRIMLGYSNIRKIMAYQLAQRIRELPITILDGIGGIPDGATELGEEVAQILEIRIIKMVKEDGKISLVDKIEDGSEVMLIEDFCTRGTGFQETVRDVISKHPGVLVVPYEPVIINRGGLKEVVVEGIGAFKIVSIAEKRIDDWDPKVYCKLCKDFGSVPIKPKATDGNWKDITTSQLP